MTEMTRIKQALLPSIRKNREREAANTFYNEMLKESLMNKADSGATRKISDHLESILDIRLEIILLSLFLRCFS